MDRGISREYSSSFRIGDALAGASSGGKVAEHVVQRRAESLLNLFSHFVRMLMFIAIRRCFSGKTLRNVEVVGQAREGGPGSTRGVHEPDR
jgi:hypothetical protein